GSRYTSTAPAGAVVSTRPTMPSSVARATASSASAAGSACSPSSETCVPYPRPTFPLMVGELTIQAAPSPLDAPGGELPGEGVLERVEDRQDGHAAEHGGCRHGAPLGGELVGGEVAEADADGPALLAHQQRVGEDELAVGADELVQEDEQQHRHADGQDHAPEGAPARGAVDHRLLLEAGRQRVEVALEDPRREGDGAPGVGQDQAREGVQQVEAAHQV